ncbi:Hypothetical protein RY67_1797 [Bifidobacterium longum subsp. infantis]|uniref:Uncharacterized protein n=1 Tax=Bifidobacterium longum subsp. infantis TaxID=1682 RepID=A0A0M4LHX2_BIFLI|nr:Hypothetical protein RY67_1797 [Bifidobacterium longum subsp. infantis]
MSAPNIPSVRLIPTFNMRVANTPTFLVSHKHSGIFHALARMMQSVPNNACIGLIVMGMPKMR